MTAHPDPKADRHEFNPDWVVPPGEHLLEALEDSRLPRRSWSKLLGIPPELLDRLLAGDEPLTEDLARSITRLPLGFGTVQLWLNLERNYREGLAAGKKRLA